MNTNYASFGDRLVGIILDIIIFGIPTSIVTTIIGAITFDFLATLISLGAFFAYETYFNSSDKQGTFGKQIMKIKVTDMNGGRISMQTAAVRAFASYISGAILLMGYFLALFTEKKQTLHDIIANTLVLKA